MGINRPIINPVTFTKIEARVEEHGKTTPPTPNSCSTSSSPSPDLVQQQANPNRGVTEYLTQLLRDQANIMVYRQSHIVLHHVDRLVEEEIEKVRSKLLETVSTDSSRLELPEPIGEISTITRKVFFPKKEFPDFNFTGRILGPRGATIKRLEKEIGAGCTLAIRGKGSDPKNEATRPSLEEQHVLVTIKETPNRVNLVLDYALKKINPFLSPVDEEKDELKKSQMIELALLKGNYRDSSINRQLTDQLKQMMISNSLYSQTPPSYFMPSAPPSPSASNSMSFGFPIGLQYSGGR
jgi:hypothetical protein